MTDVLTDSFNNGDYDSYPEEEYMDYIAEEDAEDANLEVEEIAENEITDQQDERYYDTWTDTISDFTTNISLEEIGDIPDPRFIYTGPTYGNRYRDQVQDATPPLEGRVPTGRIVNGTWPRQIQEIVDGEDVTDMADTTVSNDTKVILETPRPTYSSKDIGYRKRRTPNTNRRGNRVKDAPYQAKILSSVPIPPIEEVDSTPTIVTINTAPLSSLNPKKLVSRDPRLWYPLPQLKTVLNSTGLVTIPTETSDRKYVSHLALSLIEQYNVQYNEDEA